MSYLILVRHGQSTWNLEKKFTGWVDVDLTENGELEAKKSGKLIKSKNIDIVLADTAGRLPTQKNLIDEITKIKRVITKCHSVAPQEVMLVIDANTGQNAINQLKIFNDALNVTGLIITKLDGTAKGGIVAAIAKDQPTPLRFVGVGEKIDDLKVFNAEDYVEGMIE